MLKQYVFLIFALLALVFPKKLYAEESVIRVTGFNFPRNRFALVHPQGLPPPLMYGTRILYGLLKEPGYFGNSGTVTCSVEFTPFVDKVVSGALVTQDGKLVVDVFFGGLSNIELSSEEVIELKSFLTSGGVLYISGYGGENSGPQYNTLFEGLGLSDYFSYDVMSVGPYVQSETPSVQTPIIDGPFGYVEELLHGNFRRLVVNSMSGVARSKLFNEYILSETAYGKGYLIVTADRIYIDDYIRRDNDNYNYFLNLFALGCKHQPEKEISVPSFKQGISPYDGVEPYWENFIYDQGDKQDLWCGETMNECWCVVTSAAMILKKYGVNMGPYNEEVNPDSLNRFLGLFGASHSATRDEIPLTYYSSLGYMYGNVVWDAVGWYSLFARDHYPSQTILDQPIYEKYSLFSVKDHIDKGIPVILKVKTLRGGFHWVVVKGYDGERLVINDPATPDPSFGRFSTLEDFGYVPASGRSVVYFIPANTDYSSLIVKTISPIQVLLVDNFGRKTGQENTEVVEEIPESVYLFNEAQENPGRVGVLYTLGEGTYELKVYRPGSGCYELFVNETAGNTGGVVVYGANSQGQAELKSLNKSDIVCVGGNEILDFGIPANLDVKPGVETNLWYMNNKCVTPVGMILRNGFDYRRLDFSSFEFGPGRAKMIHETPKIIDLDGDNNLDVLMYFETEKVGLGIGNTRACLIGKSRGGIDFEICDNVQIVQ